MNKREVAEEILSEGRLFVHFDPHVSDVPANLKTGLTCSFQYGYQLPIPIPDLFLNDDGISATLSFSGKKVFTFVPWKAVQAMCNDAGIGQMWDATFLKTRPALKRPLFKLIRGGKR